METFIVIPCLNEQAGLAATCASLGFGYGIHPGARLVLVDNGSTDGTLAVMEQVRTDTATDAVLLAAEPRRGYVPARRAGIDIVLACAQKEQTPLNQVLILQADADTIYLEGYIDAMRSAFSTGTGQMLEGCAVTNREFNAQYPEFTRLCRLIDEKMEPLLAREEDQFIVDDKVSAFSLSDYLLWGEHQEETDAFGRPVYAETTRLFIRAYRVGGAQHIRVLDACALPSRRKLLVQAPAYFASSGFPRDKAWIATWACIEDSAAFLCSPSRSREVGRLIRSRQRHQLALLAVLPSIMRADESKEGSLSELFRQRSQIIAEKAPGEILGEILSLADKEDGPIDAAVVAYGHHW